MIDRRTNLSLFRVRAAGARCAAILALLLLPACLPPDVLPPVPEGRPSRAELLRALDQARESFHSVRGFARSSIRRNGDKKSAQQVVLAQYPDRLRVETMGLFGSPLLLATTDGERTSVLLPGEGRAFVGPASSGFLQRVLHLPLTTENIVSILLVRPEPIAWLESGVAYPDAVTSRLVLRGGPLRQEFDFDADRRIVRMATLADGEALSVVRYDDYRQGYPYRITLQIPLRELEARLEFTDIEWNVAHDAGVFTLVPTSGYVVEPIPVDSFMQKDMR